MRRKTIIIVALILIGAVAILIGVKARGISATKHETLAQAEMDARQQSNLPACLNLQSQNEPRDEKSSEAIVKVVGAKLTDRPKTTTYALYYKSFSNTTATGTIIYDGTSGNTFNFKVSRANTSDAWKLTNFEACR